MARPAHASTRDWSYASTPETAPTPRRRTSFTGCGDFHPLNVLVRDDGTAVVIDWSGLQVSDARFDVAWVLIMMTAISGAGWRDRTLQEYDHLAGGKVEQVEFFEAGACLRLLSVLIASTIKGMHPNVEYML